MDTFTRFPARWRCGLINDRPPCLETPWRYFQHDLTPNEAFYVRWHLQAVPTGDRPEDLAAPRDGAVDRPLELSMDDLRRMGRTRWSPSTSARATPGACSARGSPGAQWRQRGDGQRPLGGRPARQAAAGGGVKRDAVEVTFDGLDEGPLASVPDFVKALDIDHALQPEITVAFSMNGAPLPVLNGFPARLVVPGWYATYWVKGLHRITVLPHRFRRLLDGQGVPDPGHAQRRRRPAREADRANRPDQPDERPLVRHLARAGGDAAGGPGRRGLRDRLRRRQRHPGRRGLHRRRLDLGRGDPGRRPGPVSLPPLALPLDPGSPGEHQLRSGPRPGTARSSPTWRAGTAAGT